MKPRKVIEIIMAQHWDMGACDCWICQAGRANKIGVYEENMPYKLQKPYGFVRVDGCWMQNSNDA